MLGAAAEVAGVILSKSPIAVMLVTCHLELMTLQHYTECVREDDAVDPLFQRLLKCHRLEESQHARIDALELACRPSRLEQIAVAIDEYLEFWRRSKAFGSASRFRRHEPRVGLQQDVQRRRTGKPFERPSSLATRRRSWYGRRRTRPSRIPHSPLPDGSSERRGARRTDGMMAIARAVPLEPSWGSNEPAMGKLLNVLGLLAWQVYKETPRSSSSTASRRRTTDCASARPHPTRRPASGHRPRHQDSSDLAGREREPIAQFPAT